MFGRVKDKIVDLFCPSAAEARKLTEDAKAAEIAKAEASVEALAAECADRIKCAAKKGDSHTTFGDYYAHHHAFVVLKKRLEASGYKVTYDTEFRHYSGALITNHKALVINW
ncbi:hypothetical protein [uncultured Cohaesibacter sp.]|uniref:hypothetical protein n=1 Tax=uncultured Cohaesibacter sp. TaxID=1002546 RepID=UPI0029C8A65C|nr:hypothetical protein [uncultured Cohaesibacter sp.]